MLALSVLSTAEIVQLTKSLCGLVVQSTRSQMVRSSALFSGKKENERGTQHKGRHSAGLMFMTALSVSLSISFTVNVHTLKVTDVCKHVRLDSGNLTRCGRSLFALPKHPSVKSTLSEGPEVIQGQQPAELSSTGRMISGINSATLSRALSRKKTMVADSSFHVRGLKVN